MDKNINLFQTKPQSLDYAIIGSRIRACRKQKKMTQTDLGKAAGLSTSFVGHIERGSRTPSVETLFHIATVLDVSVDGLLTGLETLKEPSANVTARMRMLNDIMRVLNEHADEWMHAHAIMTEK